MERKHFFLIIGTIIITQFLNTVIISKQFSRQETETIYVPVQQETAYEQDGSAPPLTTAAIRLPTEQALRKLIRSALKKELHEITKNQQGIRFTGTDTEHATGTKQAPTTVESIDPQISEEAWNNSIQIVNQAIENGIWTDQNNNEIAENIIKLNRQQQSQLIDKLGEALERGDLQLEDGTVPVI